MTHATQLAVFALWMGMDHASAVEAWESNRIGANSSDNSCDGQWVGEFTDDTSREAPTCGACVRLCDLARVEFDAHAEMQEAQP